MEASAHSGRLATISKATKRIVLWTPRQEKSTARHICDANDINPSLPHVGQILRSVPFLCWCPMRRTPHVIEDDKRFRLRWANTHVPPIKNNKKVWGDEKKASKDDSDRMAPYRLDPRCHEKVFLCEHTERFRLMVWASFYFNYISEILFVNEMLNAECYCEVLYSALLPFAYTKKEEFPRWLHFYTRWCSNTHCPYDKGLLGRCWGIVYELGGLFTRAKLRREPIGLFDATCLQKLWTVIINRRTSWSHHWVLE